MVERRRGGERAGNERGRRARIRAGGPRRRLTPGVFAVLMLLAVAARDALADPPAPSRTDPVAPLGGILRARPLDLLGPFHADATPAPSTQSATRPQVEPGGGCKSDEDCAGRAYCQENRCVEPGRKALLYYYQPGQRGYRYFVPLYWHWWSPDGSGRIVFPFYWHFADAPTRTSNTFVLLFQHRRDPEFEAFRFWPLLFHHRYGPGARDGNGTGLFPLFWAARRGDRTTGVSPLLLSGWWSERASGDYRVVALGGLGYFARDRTATVGLAAPLLWYRRPSAAAELAGERATVALPLLLTGWSEEKRSGDWRALVLGLGYFAREGGERTGVVFPFVWYRRSPERARLTLFPLVDILRTPGVLRVESPPLAPLFAWYRRESSGPGGARRTSFALPLFLTGGMRETSTGDWRAVVLGLGYFSRERGARLSMVLPFVAASSGPATSTLALPLLLSGSSRDRATGDWRALVLGVGYLGKSGAERTGVLFPLVWYHRGSETSTLALPLLLSGGSRDRATGDWRALVLGVGYLGKSGAERTGVLFPLVWYHRGSETSTLALPLLLSGGSRDRATGDWRALVLGVGYLGKSGAERTGVLFPLVWYHRGSETSTLALPLLLSGGSRDRKTGDFRALALGVGYLARQGAERTAALFPLFGYRRSRETSTLVVPPLVSGGSWNHATGDWYALLLGVGYLARSGAERTAMLVPLVVYHRGVERSTLALPLLLSGGSRDHKTGDWRALLFGVGYLGRSGVERTGVLFPLVWYHRGVETSTLALPLLVSGGSRDRKTGDWRLFVGGLGYFSRRGESRTAFVLPVFGWQRTAASTRWALPLLLSGGRTDRRSGDASMLLLGLGWRSHWGETRTTVVFPLFWRIADNRASTTLVGPLYWRRSRDTFHAGLAPLAGFGVVAGLRYGWALPLLLLHVADPPARTAFTLAGPVVYARDPTGWTAALFPLAFAWRRERATGFLGPLLYHDDVPDEKRSTTVVGPLYFGHGPAHRYGGLFPLFFYRGQADGTWQATLIPLFHAARKRDGIRLLLPFAGLTTYAGGGAGFLGPIYVRSDDSGHTVSIIPLFHHAVDRRAGTITNLLIPLFLDRRTPRGSLFALTPLLWHSRDGDTTATVGLPLFFDWHRQRVGRATGLLPLFVRYHDEVAHTTTALIPPLLLYLRATPDGSDAVAFPLAWRFVGEGPNRGRSSTGVFPLFWDIRRGPKQTQLFLPFYARWSRPDADRLWFLNLFYRRGKGPREGSYHVHVVPFFDFGRERAGDLEWNLLGGLVGYWRVGHKRALKLFFLPITLGNTSSSARAPSTFFDATATSARRSMD